MSLDNINPVVGSAQLIHVDPTKEEQRIRGYCDNYFQKDWEHTKKVAHDGRNKAEKQVLLNLESQKGVSLNPLSAKDRAILLSDALQGAPNYQQPLEYFTSLGNYTTAVAQTVLNMPMTMAQDEDPIMARVKGMFEDAQGVYIQYRGAQVGLAEGATFGSPIASSQTTGRGFQFVSTGMWGAKVTLGIDEIALIRDTKAFDGTYAAEAMRRAIAKVCIQMYQRQRLVIARTIADNEYTYYQNSDGSQKDTISYGRLDQNTYTPAVPWQTITKDATTGKIKNVVYNANANPIYDLLDWFTSQENTIIRNMMPYLRGLAMNPVTSRIFTKYALNNKDPIAAVSFMAAFGAKTYGANGVIRSNIPALKDVDIVVYEGMVNTEVSPTGLYITEKEYIIPDGVIIPIFDYEQTAMGQMIFTPEPRRDWMSNTTALPNGALGVSDPRAAYMRVISSLETPTAESPFWSVEAGARYAFINAIAAGTSYILNIAETKYE